MTMSQGEIDQYRRQYLNEAVRERDQRAPINEVPSIDIGSRMTPETKPEEIPETVMRVVGDMIQAMRDANHFAFANGEKAAPAVKEAIARAIMAYSQRDQWMPIETAKKDGKAVWLAHPCGFIEPAYFNRVGSGFWAHLYGGHPIQWTPRLWQHLPTPPKSEA